MSKPSPEQAIDTEFGRAVMRLLVDHGVWSQMGTYVCSTLASDIVAAHREDVAK